MESLFSQEHIVSTLSAIISIAAALTALIGLFFTYRKNKFDKQLALDKELFEASIRTLGSAFEMLTQDIPESGLALSNRLNWIMSAREIEKFKVLKSKIATEHYRLSLDSIEDYWSHKFYSVIGKNSLIQQCYYKDLHAGSVLIVYAFASWKSEQKCPIDNVNYERLLAESYVFKGRYGLQEYIKNDGQFSHLVK